MNIQLSPESQAFITSQVQQGVYPDETTLLEVAIHRLQQEMDIEYAPIPQEFLDALQVGLEQVERGQIVPWNAETRLRIRQRAKDKIKNGGVVNPLVCP